MLIKQTESRLRYIHPDVKFRNHDHDKRDYGLITAEDDGKHKAQHSRNQKRIE